MTSHAPATTRTRGRFAAAAGLAVAVLALGACNMNGTANPLDTAGFREARYQEIEKIRAFRACRDEALDLDAQARTRASAGAYLTSAQVLERCEADLGEAAGSVGHDERMRLQALAVVNYIRGGNIDAARRGFDAFRAKFPDNDLYFADGASFTATVEVLLGRAEPISFGTFAALNVNDDVQSEMRRLHHWKNK